MSANRIRDVKLEFFVTPKEHELIVEKMDVIGIKNKSAYLRKMAIDGYIIKQDLSILHEAIISLNRIGNNVNQIAKVANTYGADEIHSQNLELIHKGLDELCQLLISKKFNV